MNRRKLIAWISAFTFAGVLMYYAGGCVPINRPPAAQSKPATSNRFAILFYGDGDQPFSSGLDKIAAELQARGFVARCYRHGEWQRAVDDVAASGATDIVEVGHSFGVDAMLRAAAALQERGRQVRVAVALDGSQPRVAGGNFATAIPLNRPITPNVKRVVVFCIPSTPIPFPGPPAPCPRFQWTTATIIETPAVPGGLNHLTIHESPVVRQLVLAAVLG